MSYSLYHIVATTTTLAIAHCWGSWCLNEWVVRLPMCLACKGFNKLIHQKFTKIKVSYTIKMLVIGQKIMQIFFHKTTCFALFLPIVAFTREVNRSSKYMKYLESITTKTLHTKPKCSWFFFANLLEVTLQFLQLLQASSHKNMWTPLKDCGNI